MRLIGHVASNRIRESVPVPASPGRRPLRRALVRCPWSFLRHFFVAFTSSKAAASARKLFLVRLLREGRLQVIIRGIAARLPQRGIGPWFAGSASSGRASHTFTVRSALAEARRRPSGLNATPLTGPVCPLRVRVSRAVL